jgi:hypothetical protein
MVNWAEETYAALQEDAEGATPQGFLELRIRALEGQNEALKESLSDVKAQFALEDRGWTLIAGITAGERLEGLDLSEVQDISEVIRPHVVGDGLTKRGVDLHSGYVWSKGMNIEGTSREAGKRGASSNLQAFYRNPVNQDSLFSATAHQELQKARYTDGNVLLSVNVADKEVRRIPFNQIVALKVNPEFPEEVWAYLRKWDPQDGRTDKIQRRWYYTNRFTGKKTKTITTNGDTVPVADEVIVDRRFNRQIGWPLGIPDAVAAMPWIAAYEEIMQYGRVVNESLAKILYKVISKTKAGATTAAVKVSGIGGHGTTASMLEGQDVSAVSTAGKGYDFITARPVAAMAAAALNVPNIEFLSDSSAAGSSYGAAQSLSPATKNAMRLMQSQWIELYQEILALLNISTPRIWFESLDDADLYREMQATTLGAVALEDEEYRGKVLDLLNIPGDPAKIPDILKFRTAAADPAAQQAAPDQGSSNGTGGGGQGANDQRSDTIEALRRQMADEDILRRWESVVERLEASSR